MFGRKTCARDYKFVLFKLSLKSKLLQQSEINRQNEILPSIDLGLQGNNQNGYSTI
jgi:hypothetical protein